MLRTCSSFDSHSLSLAMSHEPSIWMPTDVTLRHGIKG